MNKKSFVIGYELVDDKIKVNSTNKNYRMINNTEENIKILNKEIVKNKLMIANIIDEYENDSNERLMTIIFNLILLGIAGIITPFTLFMGTSFFFIFSIISFAFLLIPTTILLYKYYFKVKQIDLLKSATGYKESNEFSFHLFTSNEK